MDKSWVSNKIKLRAAFLDSISLDSLDVEDWSNKWLTKKKNAKNSKIEFDLSFEDYMNKIVDAGIKNPNQIGRHIGDFALGRLGDIGGYTVPNCRFILVEDNLMELILNGGAARSHDKQRGRTKVTHKYLQSISDKRKQCKAETHDWVRIRAEKIRGRTKNTDSGIASATAKCSLYFKVFSPDGSEFVGHNISNFCRNHSYLNPPTQSNLSMVCRGDKLSCKGWTGRYTTKEEFDSYDGIKSKAV